MKTHHCPQPLRAQARLLAIGLAAAGSALLGVASALDIPGGVQTYDTLPGVTVTLEGRSELRITGSGDPIAGSTIHLNSPDSWVVLTGLKPADVASGQLGKFRVDGAAADPSSNVRVVQYGGGTIIIPHGPDFRPLTVFDGVSFTGNSRTLRQYTNYGWQELGAFNDAITSFKLKRGYMATFASEPNGAGITRNYVAADGDLEIGRIHRDLNNATSFVRVFPWRWVSKKGTCDTSPDALNAAWNYNWNINSQSTSNWEYVAIKQQRWWPSLNQDWRARGVNHVSGFNEPDNSVEDAYTTLGDGSRDVAVSVWPELMGTGLRVGAPAVTDGGLWWLEDFMNKANTAGHRVDYVPVHYYRSYWNKDDPVGAANQLYNFLKQVHDMTGLPVWVTEFNNGANWTDNAHDPNTDQNRNAIEAMINRMDSTWWIERYAIYSDVEWFRRTHYDDGSLTPMGAMYRDHQSPIGYQQVVPSAGMSAAAEYDFDGDLRDRLFNGNDGMAVGAPQFVPGKTGEAISLDGQHDYVQLAEPLGDSNDFTFAGWVNWNGGGNWQRIFDFGNGGTDNYVFLTPKSSGNTMSFTIRQNGVDQKVETPTLPAVGAWTHVAVTISDTTAKIFVNGQLKATNSSFTLDPGALQTNFNYLGKSQWPQDPLFGGKLDSLRFHTYALSDAEVAGLAAATPPSFAASRYTDTATTRLPYTGSLAAAVSGGSGGLTFSKVIGPAWLTVAPDGTLSGVPGIGDVGMVPTLVRVTDSAGEFSTTTLEVTVGEPAGLVARYAFDGNATSNPGTLHGTTSGSPAYATGVNGSAIDLDGADDFVTLPEGVADLDEITIASWFRRDSTAGWQRLFDFGTGTDRYMFLSPRSGGGSVNIHFGIKNGGPEQSLVTPALPTGQWVHVAVTLGGGQGKLYVNGALADSKAISIKPSDFPHETNYIGKSQWPDPLFDGKVDEFLIFNHVLDATAIGQLANSAQRPPAFSVDPINKPAATPDLAYQDSIGGSATDPNGGTGLTFSKVGGPRWLTVDPDGRISGVPSHADAGTNRFVVRVTDPAGYIAEVTMTIVVSAPPGLLAHYQFDGNAVDSAGGYHGTTFGGPGYIGAGTGQALDLDGADDFATLPSGMMNGTSDVTFAARVRWDGGGDWQRLFDFGTGTGAYFFLTPKTGPFLRFTIKNGGGEQQLNALALQVGEWADVVVTLVGNTGSLYVNGVLVDSQPISIDPGQVAPTQNFLGDSQFGADPFFNGAIDEFRIYNRGLSAAEVASLTVPLDPVIVPVSDYDAWTGPIAFPVGKDLPEIDADLDGLANVFEFLFGSNPLAPGPNSLPQGVVRSAAEMGLAGDKHYLTISARVRTDRNGVALIAEAGATPSELSLPAATAHAIPVGAPVPDGDFEILTWRYDVAIEDSPSGRGFMRLRAEVDE
ncbi:fibronectin type III domain-containing protein [Haloferula helveola]|uniref:Fibronectin type III domain-containing protein n=1 Tax=Haloferula helveola TaxID=490095 RepID=A0ABN6H1V3_9BACT|nr:fibronectin type III domain-containing protein [Haloferula helveola]